MSHQSLSGTNNGCAGCSQPDEADNMVQCDACDAWWHFSCAGVTESISDRAWMCTHCQPTSLASSKVSTASRSSSLLADSMARLRERQELEKQRAEIEMEKKFLQEQQKLLEVAIATEEEKRSRASHENSIKRVHDWIGNSANLQIGASQQTLTSLEGPLCDPQPSQKNTDAGAMTSTPEELTTASPLDLSIRRGSPLRDRTIPTFDTPEDIGNLRSTSSTEAGADHRVAMNMARAMRMRLTRYLEQSESSFPQWADVQQQLELCRKEMEGMHSTVQRLSSLPSLVTPTTAQTDVETAINREGMLAHPGTLALGATTKQHTTLIPTGKSHASESQTEEVADNNVYQMKLGPNVEISQNEQRRLTNANSNLINNNIVLQKQTINHCTPIPLTITKPKPSTQQPSVQSAAQQPQMQLISALQYAMQPVSQQRFSVQQPSVHSAVQQPQMQSTSALQYAMQPVSAQRFSMHQPSVQSAVQQPQMQPISVQQHTMQPSLPQHVAVQQFSVQQPSMQSTLQQPQVQPIPVQQHTMASSFLQQSAVR